MLPVHAVHRETTADRMGESYVKGTKFICGATPNVREDYAEKVDELVDKINKGEITTKLEAKRWLIQS